MLKSLNKKSLLREILVSGKELGGSLKDLPRIEPDGYITKYGKEIKDILDGLLNDPSRIEPKLGGFIVHHKGEQTKITYRNVALFPKRAILRIGMLLRDSEVAKEVRTQLLNIEENTATEIKTYEIDHETELHTKLVRAIANTSKESN
ncbi:MULTISPECIES: hypothetical protein [Bacillus cereus group]|uniref:hypothetical protein n=1 Tax=Bacillus cereus group TaxID=86661 RepID=UPI0022E1DD73|nr:hypothetical protein [Bacillus paranthracis]MED1136635.1 hypothetical protein [Bacillus paranthracis]